MKTLAQLKEGETCKIVKFTDAFLALKFIEMGCLPGEKIQHAHTAPFGCPLSFTVSGYKISMRKSEAATIIIE